MAVIRFFSLCVLGLALVTWSVIGAETVDIAAKIRQQNPALIAEAFLGNEAEVKRLLAGGESPDQSNSAGQTALMMAASRGHSDIAKALLERGADVNLADKDGTTALMLAAQNGSAGIAALLLTKNAFVDASHQTGFTPLMYAATSDHEEVAKLLLDAGADIAKRDKKERTPLIIAAINNSYKVAKLLLAAGASPNEKSKNGLTAMQYAQGSDDQKLIDLFAGKEEQRAGNDTARGNASNSIADEQLAKEAMYFALRANAFRFAASKNAMGAIKQWGCVSCPGYNQVWEETFAVFREYSVPDESVNLFFAGAILLLGHVSRSGAVLGFYNPWFDGVLLTEMTRSGASSAILSAKLQFVAGESWRDEAVKDGNDLLKLFNLREPLLLALARNYHVVESRFTAWYPPSGAGDFIAPELTRRCASNKEELRPIISRMLYQAASYNVFESQQKQWVLPELKQLSILLQKGEISELRAYLSPQQDQVMLESICMLPEANRSHLGPVYYAQGKDDSAIAALITPTAPRWVFAVQILGDGDQNKCRIEVFDLLHSGKLLDLYNRK